jgi:hypothetical protein
MTRRANIPSPDPMPDDVPPVPKPPAIPPPPSPAETPPMGDPDRKREPPVRDPPPDERPNPRRYREQMASPRMSTDESWG